MKLFWHIGPHKTGTTSLQLALAAHAASGHASYYYPPTPEHGPGHAVLAWRLLGLNAVEKVPGVVRAEIDRADSLGYSKVVISSEEFSRALLTPELFEPFGRICDEVECELIVTLRPLADRVHPEVQELIKHGRAFHFESAGEFLTACVDRPGLRADFLPAAIFGTRAAAVSVVVVDPGAPHKLFDDMSTIIGDKLPATTNQQANASYSFIKTAWLEAINRYGGVRSGDARRAVDASFAAGSRELKALGTVPYPPLPTALKRYLDGVWELQLAFLRVLEEGGRLRRF